MDMETIAHQAFHAVLAAVILFTIIPARVTADSAPQGVEAAASQQETSGAACDLPPSGESLEGAAEAQKNASIPMLDLQGKGPLKTATFALG